MRYVRPKKRFGQHYLKDDNVLMDIVETFKENHTAENILEIGPGMGALTRFLWDDFKDNFTLVELDRRCIAFLTENYEGIEEHLIQADFLKLDLHQVLSGSTSIIGNFPYNISSQIVFKILENHTLIPLVVGMFQKEVAMRLASDSGNRVYGVISVLAQLYYDISVGMHISPDKFDPPPKVVSTVLIMKLHHKNYPVDQQDYRKVVKAAFHTRRKKLKNALSGLATETDIPEKYIDKRAEQLSIEDFVELTNWFTNNKKGGKGAEGEDA